MSNYIAHYLNENFIFCTYQGYILLLTNDQLNNLTYDHNILNYDEFRKSICSCILFMHVLFTKYSGIIVNKKDVTLASYINTLYYVVLEHETDT